MATLQMQGLWRTPHRQQALAWEKASGKVRRFLVRRRPLPLAAATQALASESAEGE